ncbi:hypothetical protein CEXT_660761, partial [Caerostris extrusa]
MFDLGSALGCHLETLRSSLFHLKPERLRSAIILQWRSPPCRGHHEASKSANFTLRKWPNLRSHNRGCVFCEV